MTNELPVWSYLRPRISLWQAKQAHVLYRNNLYRVETMPAGVFKALIRSTVRDYGPTVRLILEQDRLDIIDRWYVLLCTTDGNYPLKLYYLKGETT
jgi:hypothetical protein